MTDLTVNFEDAEAIAARIDAEICALTLRNTASERAVRRKYSRSFRQADAEFILEVARTLLAVHGQRWLAYELIADHPAAFQRLSEAELEEFGQGIKSWGEVDSFARTLAGPAWLRGQVSDKLFERWADSEDRWWRRAALVSTVALNMRSQGGRGDTRRTLKICRLLVHDQDDMVEKALSWALRELVVHDTEAVISFLSEHQSTLAARVKREVWNKVTTGLKYPRRHDAAR